MRIPAPISNFRRSSRTVSGVAIRNAALLLAAGSASLFTAGCGPMHGQPGPDPEVPRPEQVVDFPTLYSQNCAACHGSNGSGGAAIALSNPVYIAVAGEDRIRQVIAQGTHGSLMPPFAKSSGGSLTDQQVSVLAHGIVSQWGNSSLLAGQTPPYAATLTADAAHGQQAFVATCARCHGSDGAGLAAKNGARSYPGSIVDASYLALISDQDLRSIVIAGRPDLGMPDWRHQSQSGQPTTDQQITDILAWLTSHRVTNPGQPYGNPAGASQPASTSPVSAPPASSHP